MKSIWWNEKKVKNSNLFNGSKIDSFDTQKKIRSTEIKNQKNELNNNNNNKKKIKNKIRKIKRLVMTWIGQSHRVSRYLTGYSTTDFSHFLN